MKWNLDKDGDALEQRWWPLLRSRFPNYEVIWQEYIVPMTFRIVEPRWLHLRPGCPAIGKGLAMTNYGVFSHLVHARASLNSLWKTVDDTALYEFFNRSYSARKGVLSFLKASGHVVAKYGGPKFPQHEPRFLWNQQPMLWRRLEATGRIVDAYHGLYTHEFGTIRLGDLIPRPESAHQYKDLSSLPTVLSKDPQHLTSEFISAKDLGEALWAELVSQVNDVWGMVVGELQQVPEREQLLSDFSALTAPDQQASWPFSGVETRSTACSASDELSAWSPQRSGTWLF